MIKNNKEKSIAALKKARSVMGKMINMMEAGECCKNIMNQNVIAVGSLRHASRSIMENRMAILLNKYVNKYHVKRNKK